LKLSGRPTDWSQELAVWYRWKISLMREIWKIWRMLKEIMASKNLWATKKGLIIIQQKVRISICPAIILKS